MAKLSLGVALQSTPRKNPSGSAYIVDVEKWIVFFYLCFCFASPPPPSSPVIFPSPVIYAMESDDGGMMGGGGGVRGGAREAWKQINLLPPCKERDAQVSQLHQEMKSTAQHRWTC